MRQIGPLSLGSPDAKVGEENERDESGDEDPERSGRAVFTLLRHAALSLGCRAMDCFLYFFCEVLFMKRYESF